MFITKYTYIQELVNRNPPKLKVFEDLLKKHNPRIYDLYNLRFKKNYTFDKINTELHLSNRRISEYLQCLDLSLKIFFDSALDDTL